MLLLAALLSGCAPGDRGTTEVITNEVQVTGDLKFFCNESFSKEAFQKAKADYDQGNRRFADAWAVVNSRELGATPKKQSICWSGALGYLGFFGKRSEIPKFIALLSKDSLLEAETTDISRLDGTSKTGMYRVISQKWAYLALAFQLRRQMIFDGKLDANALAARELIQACALDLEQCISDTSMHLYHQQMLQRGAIKALVVSGTKSDLAAYQKVKSILVPKDSLIGHVIGSSEAMKTLVEENLSAIRTAVPAP